VTGILYLVESRSLELTPGAQPSISRIGESHVHENEYGRMAAMTVADQISLLGFAVAPA